MGWRGIPVVDLSVSQQALRAAVAGRTLVVKLGGSVGRDDTLPEDATLLQQLGARVVLVHGGGPLITQWLERIGKESRFVHGLRHTDEETLDVVRMVLGGLVNGEIVARIGAAGGRALGLSGSDDHLLEARVLGPGPGRTQAALRLAQHQNPDLGRTHRTTRAQHQNPDLGLVGEVCAVHPRAIETALNAGYMAVVAPLAVTADGSFLNVNADTAAAELAVALGAEHFILLTDVDGVQDAKGRLRRLAPEDARGLIASGVISGGMVPKVEACLRALRPGRQAQIVDGRQPHVVLRALLEPSALGTLLDGSGPGTGAHPSRSAARAASKLQRGTGANPREDARVPPSGAPSTGRGAASRSRGTVANPREDARVPPSGAPSTGRGAASRSKEG